MNLKQLNRVLTQTLFLPVTALLIVGAALAWHLYIGLQVNRQIQATDQVIATASLVQSLIDNQEQGVHDYQRTGKQVNLQPYEFAVDPLIQQLQSLRVQLAAQATDLVPVDDLIRLHDEWMEKAAAPLIRAARNRASPELRALDLDALNMQKMRAIAAGILDRQRSERAALADRWQHDATRTMQAAVVFTFFGALVLGLFANSRIGMVSDAYQNTMEALRSTAQATYESEQRLRAMLTSIREGVVVCDEDGRIELLNTAAQQLSGWTQAAASHRHMELVFPLVDELTNEPIGPTEFSNLPSLHPATTSDDEAAPRSALLVRSDGSEFYVERSEAPIYDRAGYVTGTVIVISNVTERRRTQAALLASEKLAVAGRLAATIAHEIHNPLDSVVNLLYMMKQGTTDEEREEFIEMAQSELARVTNISRAMLGMHRESRTPIDLNISATMQSVLVLLERTISKMGIGLKTTLEPETLAVGYPAELRQVFTNLLTNAAEASAPGSIIEVEVANQDARRADANEPATLPGVLIRVTDHGSGIPAPVFSELFRPFFTTKGERGSGLGLWISKGIIEKHAGSISVTTQVATPEHPDQHGTTFTVFLPRGAVIPLAPVDATHAMAIPELARLNLPEAHTPAPETKLPRRSRSKTPPPPAPPPPAVGA